jgi:hypothetical protein
MSVFAPCHSAFDIDFSESFGFAHYGRREKQGRFLLKLLHLFLSFFLSLQLLLAAGDGHFTAANDGVGIRTSLELVEAGVIQGNSTEESGGDVQIENVILVAAYC